MRGWIHCNTDGFDYAASSRISDASRQILITLASTPANAVLGVDDVILGAIAASSGTVPSFTSDARKALGTAITDAEKTGAGTLRVKRWRAGTTTSRSCSAKRPCKPPASPIDPKIDAAIQRASGFLGSYVNKGGIPYGEHFPTLWHASNGKDASAPLFLGLQADKAVQAEYFSRLAIAAGPVLKWFMPDRS